MIPVHEAADLILQRVRPLGVEWIDLSQAQERVLAESLISSQDFPGRPTSSMDGYAVRVADLDRLPAQLSVVESVPAGTPPQISLGSGQAARVFTGSILPEGADLVIIQEHTRRIDEQTVAIEQGGAAGLFVRPQGSFCRRGTEVIGKGQRLAAPEIAVLSALQRSNIPVFRRPRVAILSTGSELVRIDQTPQPGQIVDSNRYGLSALVQQVGGVPLNLGIVPDHPQSLRERIAEALNSADVVVSSGGVSVGEYDYVEQILEALGGEICLRKVAIKPGKPLTFAVFNPTQEQPRLYFGLPGNPVSALVTFWRFLDPVLQRLQGQDPSSRPQVLTAVAQQDLRSDGKRETYLWGHLHISEDGVQFVAVADHNSGNLFALAGCTGLGILPVGQTEIKAGEPVQVMIIPR